MSDQTSSSSGIGFCGMLTILFIGLKLTDNIDWSWWYVLSPTLIPLSLLVLILSVAGVFFVGVKIFTLIKGA